MIKVMDLQPMVKSILFLYFRISFNLTDMYKLQLGIYGRSKVQKLLETRVGQDEGGLSRSEEIEGSSQLALSKGVIRGGAAASLIFKVWGNCPTQKLRKRYNIPLISDTYLNEF